MGLPRLRLAMIEGEAIWRQMKTLIQCDFDGTITEEDASFFLLDSFAQGDWRELLQEYREHRISVGEFNTRAFAMVKVDKQTLLGAIKNKVKIREGFQELVAYCSRNDFRFVIVSNGLAFYIEAILKRIGLEDIEAHAARTMFHPDGVKVKYVGPEERQLKDGLKGAYIKLFLKEGYRVIYIGNGDSDILPAKYAQRVFATGDLLAYCRDNGLECKPFDEFSEVIRGLELL